MITQDKISSAYDEYSRELLAFILGFVPNKDTAEDLLHDAFVKLIKYSEKDHVTDDNIRALLYRISRNICIDHLRSSQHTRVTAVTAEYLSNFADERKDKDTAGDLCSAIREIISSLDEPARSVFIMRNDQGLTFDETATALNMSVRTAKRRMDDSLKFLAQELKKRGLV